ncbi:hypothetical protein DIKCMJMK_02165 [Shewanella oneidensis]|nr:hypothetical protein [Shewanella oneidensis]
MELVSIGNQYLLEKYNAIDLTNLGKRRVNLPLHQSPMNIKFQ